MYYTYQIIPIKPKRNIWVIVGAITISIIIIGLSIFGGIKYSQYSQAKIEEQKIQNEILEEQEQIRIAEEEQREKERIEREREAIRLKNSLPLTEEQIKAIENIYDSEEKRVFLTFDDGPTTSVTPFILDLLKQENIKATFFVLGNRAKANEDLIKREFNEGHYIANHGYTHKYSTIYANTKKVFEEYNYTEQCIKEALGNPDYNSRVFRFPGGSEGGYYRKIKSAAKTELRKSGIVSLDWNCFTKDAEGAHTKEDMLESAIETMKDKNSVVILMHDAADKILTYETLPDLIKYLRDNGYVFKNLYDII